MYFIFVVCFYLKYYFLSLLCFSGSTDPSTKKFMADAIRNQMKVINQLLLEKPQKQKPLYRWIWIFSRMNFN